MAFSTITKRRLKRFRKNRRAFYSLLIFSVLFFLSLFAEFIANDKPLLVITPHGLFTPVISSYTEADFGGDFDLEMDYKDPESLSLLHEQDSLIFWPLIRYHWKSINYEKVAPSPPDSENWLGTDDQSRDVVARVLYGFRISVLFALTLTLLSSIIGVIAGAIQGFYGGWVDLSFQRFIEIWSGLPVLYILIILASFVTPTFGWLLLIMLLFSWTALVDVVRAECLRTRNFEYVKAAKALGVSNRKILQRHVLPNALVATLTFMPFILTGALTSLTALDFLGFGLPIGSPSLGELIAQGKTNLHAPWLGITAFLTLSILLSLLVFIGEGTRDAFDPRADYNS